MAATFTVENATSEVLNKFYKTDALVLEGLVPEDIGEYANWINENAGGLVDGAIFYQTNGRFFDNSLDIPNIHLSDLTIFVLDFMYIKDISRLAIARFQVGARWLRDIVDNAKLNGTDYDEFDDNKYVDDYDDDDDYYDVDDD